MNKKNGVYSIFIITCFGLLLILLHTGCANIIPPGGGPRDSLPPVLITATPRDSSTHFNTNKITLTFNEYVTVDNPQENLIVSPNPTNPPVIESKLRTVTIRLQDSLKPNTTYALYFGSALKDVNEGNSDRNFDYIFSTGSQIDENTIKGNVVLAETGKVDTTLLVVLHKNTADSAVSNEKPDYYTKLDSKGNFTFKYLPKETFAIYAVPNSYTKRYADSTDLFAFADSLITAGDSTEMTPITLYAYQEAKEKPKASSSSSSNNKIQKEKPVLRVTSDVGNSGKDILTPLRLTFSEKLRNYDTAKFHLTDTNYVATPNVIYTIDTSFKIVTLSTKWSENTPYKLVIEKDAVTDTSGANLSKNDTINFVTKREADYGSVHLHFNNIDLAKNPVLQLVQNDKVVDSILLTSRDWNNKMYTPGEYQIRILYDDNKNGTWDPGHFFGFKRQPEIVISVQRSLNIRANWDNEVDINL
ncbi:MAG: Ig-like domain-containing protein [Ilyomonas sp.]